MRNRKARRVSEAMIDEELARQDGLLPPRVQLALSVWQIAGGVLLGNLFTGLIGAVVMLLYSALLS